jgi:hypothetical protein
VIVSDPYLADTATNQDDTAPVTMAGLPLNERARTWPNLPLAALLMLGAGILAFIVLTGTVQ